MHAKIISDNNGHWSRGSPLNPRRECASHTSRTERGGVSLSKAQQPKALERLIKLFYEKIILFAGIPAIRWFTYTCKVYRYTCKIVVITQSLTKTSTVYRYTCKIIKWYLQTFLQVYRQNFLQNMTKYEFFQKSTFCWYTSKE